MNPMATKSSPESLMSTSNKININNTEYDVRDLSEQAQQIVSLLSIADNKIQSKQAELIVLQKGREVLVNDLIQDVESTPVEKE